MFIKFTGFLIGHRKAVLIVMAGITLFFVSQILRIEMFTQFLDLFPYNHPYVQVHKQYAKFFGGAYQATLMLEVNKGDVFTAETLTKISRIQDQVDLIPGVDHFGIFSIASPKVTITKEEPGGFSSKQLMETVPDTQEGIEELKRKVFTSAVSGTLVSTDSKALLLNAAFIEERVDFNTLYDVHADKEEGGRFEPPDQCLGTPLVYGWIYHYLPRMADDPGGQLAYHSRHALLLHETGGLWWRPFLDGIITPYGASGFPPDGLPFRPAYHRDPLPALRPCHESRCPVDRAVRGGVPAAQRRHQEAAAHHGGGTFSSRPYRDRCRHVGPSHHRHHPHPDLEEPRFHRHVLGVVRGLFKSSSFTLSLFASFKR